MKLTIDLLRTLDVGEHCLVTEAHGRPIKGQGDVSHLLHRLKPRRFVQKRFVLVDPEALTAAKVIRIERLE